MPSRGMFTGRCYLCGVVCGRTYCQEHKWAANQLGLPYRKEDRRGILREADRTIPFNLTELHEWWLATRTPDEIVAIAAELEQVA